MSDDAKNSMSASLNAIAAGDAVAKKHVATTESTAAARDMTMIAISKGVKNLNPVDPSQQKLADAVDKNAIKDQIAQEKAAQ